MFCDTAFFMGGKSTNHIHNYIHIYVTERPETITTWSQTTALIRQLFIRTLPRTPPYWRIE
jgi:hypothetical protein